MENIADALKMAGAALLFVLAFTIAMMLISKTRETSDNILDNLRLKDFFPQVEALEERTTREVGIETIIPTLYRYCQSDGSLRIRILNTDETELQVFDTGIEYIVRQDPDLTDPYQREINDRYNNPARQAYMFEAPWEGQNQETYRLERVNAYINGTQSKHMPSVNYTGKGLIQNCGRYLFEETYTEYRTSGTVHIDNYGEEIVEIPAKKKIIKIYKRTDKLIN